jgi:hypothetical protein
MSCMSATPANPADALDTIRAGYSFEESALDVGVALDTATDDRAPAPDTPIRLPLGMMNRHGLIAGATGTGKTVTLQVLAEQLSRAGVPVFASDIKGDLSGLSAAGQDNPKLAERTQAIGQDWSGRGCPVEFASLGGIGTGVPLRATVTDFGPLLLSKVLELNDTQESVLSLIFHFADQAGLALLDLSDLRAVLNHLDSPEGKEDFRSLGGASAATLGVILRQVAQLEASTLRTCCAPRTTGRASSPCWACPSCRTGRPCSPPSSCGCWRTCSRTCRRWAIRTSPRSCSSSMRRTCSSRTRRRRSSTPSRARSASSARRAWASSS